MPLPDCFRRASLNVFPNDLETPECLKDFSAAMQTCRSFHNSIVRVKFDGLSVSERLQFAQRSKIDMIMKSRCGHPWPIEIYIGWAGSFWKNPAILHDVEFMVKVISSLAYESLALFLPHLGNWVSTCSSPASEEDWAIQDCALQFEADSGDWAHSIVFQPGSRDVEFYPELSGYQQIRSVNGLYQGSEYKKFEETKVRRYLEGTLPRKTRTDRVNTLLQNKMNKVLLEKFPFLREIHDSAADTWWLFALEKSRWYLVDYGGKRIWGSGCKPIMCYWDDVWDPTSWKLGVEGCELGPEWFLFADFLELDSDTEWETDTDEEGWSEYSEIREG